MMRTTQRLLIFIVISTLLGGCRKPTETPPIDLSPEEAAAARRTIVAWLECEECDEGELDALLKLGDIAVPSLSASLLEGPSPASLEALRRHLVKAYQDLEVYEEGHPDVSVPMSEDEYIRTYTENFIALYQVRAATGLAAIGGQEAQKTLEEALELSLRDDVRAVVEESLERLR